LGWAETRPELEGKRATYLFSKGSVAKKEGHLPYRGGKKRRGYE